MTAAIRTPVLPPDDVWTTVRLSLRGSAADGYGFGFNGSASAGGIGLSGSRGSVLRAGLAIAVSPLLRCHHNARNGKRFHFGPKQITDQTKCLRASARRHGHRQKRDGIYSARSAGAVAGCSTGTGTVTGVDCISLVVMLATTVWSTLAERWNSHADALESAKAKSGGKNKNSGHAHLLAVAATLEC